MLVGYPAARWVTCLASRAIHGTSKAASCVYQCSGVYSDLTVHGQVLLLAVAGDVQVSSQYWAYCAGSHAVVKVVHTSSVTHSVAAEAGATWLVFGEE